MTETIKTIAQWTDYEKSLVQGSVIDIGCGSDPISPSARCFDIDDGDANYITKFIHETYDCVYSSHCLEHMVDAKLALNEWWKLVKPGGYLILIVPDEDLYEQENSQADSTRIISGLLRSQSGVAGPLYL